MKLKLERPLAFIDCETTGVDVQQDRIVELALYKFIPSNGVIIAKLFHEFINPQIPIPSEVIKIHHITDRKVRYALSFAQLTNTIQEFLEECDLAGFNLIGFDLPLLEVEFLRVGKKFDRVGRSLIDAMFIFHQREKRDLTGAYLKYCGRELEGAHQAQNDVQAVIEVLEGQLEAYRDLPRNVKELGDLCYNSVSFVESSNRLILVDGEVSLNFGKHKGKALSEVPHSYLQWVMKQDFSSEVREIVQGVLNGL